MTLDEMQLKKQNEIIKWTGLLLSAIPPFIFAAFGFMMGGIGGLLIVVLKMLIP